jgi:PAS domain S-box-containing protein
MTSKGSGRSNFDARELRQKSMERLQRRHSELADKGAELESLVYELEIHQAELEVQNEELRRAQVELDEAHRRYFDLYEFAPVGYVSLDEQGIIRESNLAVSKLTGVPRKKIIGRRFEQLLSSESRDAGYLLLSTASTTEARAGELRILSPEGQTLWVMAKSSPLLDPEGRLAGFRVTLGDISDRKRAEIELRKAHDELEQRVTERTQDLAKTVDTLQEEISFRHEAEAELREKSKILDAYFKHSVTPLVLLDRSFNFVRVNNVYAERWKKAVEDFPGKSYFVSSSSETRTIFEKVVRTKTTYAATAGRLSSPHQLELDITYWDWVLTPLLDDTGEVEFLVLALEDVTDRVQSEQQLRAANEQLVDRAQQLGRLAEKLNFTEQHERQRLAQILHDGLQQILVAAKYQVALAARSQNMQRELEQVMELIDGAIGTSRSLTAELSPPILLKQDLLSGLEWLARWMREKHQLDVSLIAHEKVPPLEEGLLLLLFQAVRELLFNVVKHAGVRAASVTVNRPDGEILVTIEDKGSGFDPSEVRTDGDISGGMGLFGIAERLSYVGGRMEIDSAPGQGSRFKIIVPLSEVTAKRNRRSAVGYPQVSVAISPESESKPTRDGRIRILLVDDHMVMRQGLSGLLRSEVDFEIAGEASDGESAIRLAREILPDVVLMDINMPGMDGIEATRIIHEEFPEIRIIGLSMFHEGEQRAAMREAGAVDYLTKTGPSEALFEAIRASV